MIEDDIKEFVTKFALITYLGYMGVYLLYMRMNSAPMDLIMTTISLGVILLFLEIAVKGYKTSIERLSRKIREIPMGRYGAGD